jgi:hypothetical protein
VVPEHLLEQAVTGDHNRTISPAQPYHYLWVMMTGVHWADVCFGSKTEVVAWFRDVCFAPDSGHAATNPETCRHYRKWQPYSITSSANANSFAGISRPIRFAVLRLITNSNFVGCKTGKSAGLAPFKILAT